MAQSAVDQAQATRDSAAAQVDQAKAQISLMQSQLTTAQFNLSYTDIKSPIAGRIGKANITEGNLVSPQRGRSRRWCRPIRSASSSRSPTANIWRSSGRCSPTMPGLAADAATFQPRLKLSDGTEYDQPGKIAFLDNTIDPSTGTIAVYAEFANPQLKLVPGQFVTGDRAGRRERPTAGRAGLGHPAGPAGRLCVRARRGQPRRDPPGDAWPARRHRLGGDGRARPGRDGHRLRHPEGSGGHSGDPAAGEGTEPCSPTSSSTVRGWRW